MVLSLKVTIFLSHIIQLCQYPSRVSFGVRHYPSLCSTTLVPSGCGGGENSRGRTQGGHSGQATKKGGNQGRVNLIEMMLWVVEMVAKVGDRSQLYVIPACLRAKSYDALITTYSCL